MVANFPHIAAAFGRQIELLAAVADQTSDALLALAVRRMFVSGGIKDDGSFRIENAETDSAGPVRKMWERARGGAAETFPMTRIATADFIGMNDLLGDWDHWMERRRMVQATRERSDEEIFRLFLKPTWCIEDEAGYGELLFEV